MKQLLILLSILLMVSCGNHSHGENGDHTHGDEEHSHAATDEKELGAHVITQWTDHSELFMEYDEIVKDSEVAFIVHLTKMEDFQPIRSGVLTTVLRADDGVEFSHRKEGVLRDGIFKPEITFGKPGRYTMTLILESDQLNDTHIVENVVVYPDIDSAPAAEEEEENNEITFLKEQQWKTNFNTETVEMRTLYETVPAYGVIEAKPHQLIDVSAPVNGLVFLNSNASFPEIGQSVKKGEVLAVLSSSAFSAENYQAIINRYEFTKNEFERAKVLYENKAISQKKYEAAELAFLEQKSAYETLSSQANLKNSKSSELRLTSPITGYIESIHFRFGEYLEQGKTLFTVVNDQSLILKMKLQSFHASKSHLIEDAQFSVNGNSDIHAISELNGSFLSTSRLIDAKDRSLTVLFEFKNKDHQFKIGSQVNGSLSFTNSITGLSVSHEAIQRKNGLTYVYVQKDGEHFVEKQVKHGRTYSNFIEIIDGVNEKDHVVNIGSYQVRLASLKTSEIATHTH